MGLGIQIENKTELNSYLKYTEISLAFPFGFNGSVLIDKTRVIIQLLDVLRKSDALKTF
jgi:hypothetical protein